MNMVALSKNTSFVIKALFKGISHNSEFSKYIYLNKKYIPYSLQSHCFYITSSPVQNISIAEDLETGACADHKDKKINIAKSNKTSQKRTPKEFLACEKGAGAIPHHVLMSQLQDCNSVSDQITTFCSSISLPPKEVENRKELCESLKEIFKPYLPEFKFNLFGSSINGLGFKGCDLDFSIEFSEKEDVKNIKEVPSLESVLKGEVSVAHLSTRNLMRFIRQILWAHCPDVKEIHFIKGRCPILKFDHAKYDVSCDLSCENYDSLHNTKLIRLLCQLDERFLTLTKIIRYWAKYGGFVGGVQLFNSYSFTLLVVHFLQLRNPPVLPPVKDIIQKSEYLKQGEIDDDEFLLKDLKKFKPSENTETIEELLREYFFHYLAFDYSQVISPLVSSSLPTSSMPKREISTVTIQDPFRLHNASIGAETDACKAFFIGLSEACMSYLDETIWHPSKNKWGICCLFQEMVPDPDVIKKFYGSVTIKLPLKTDVSLVRRILQEGLLIDCTESVIEDEVPQPSMRLKCEMRYKTLVGRTYKNCPTTLTDQLEIENWVSHHLLKNRKETGKKLLSTFSCVCFENTCDNQLNVVLTFDSPQYPPKIAIILKEYILSTCKKLTI